MKVDPSTFVTLLIQEFPDLQADVESNGARAMALFTSGLKKAWEDINVYMERLLPGCWVRKVEPQEQRGPWADK